MNIQPKAAAGVNDIVVSSIVSNAEPNGEVAILDLGTGQGYNAWKLHEEFVKKNVQHEITCVDIDSSAFLAKDTESITFVQSDLNGSFAFGAYDYVIATEVIEHLENPYEFLRGVLRNLKVGGSAYVTTPNVDALYSLAKLAIRRVPTKFEFGNLDHVMPVHAFMFWNALSIVNKKEGIGADLHLSYTRGLMKVPWTIPFPIAGRHFGETLIAKITRTS